MSTTEHTTSGASVPAGASVARTLSARIAELALAAESAPGFVKQACAQIVSAFKSPYGTVSVRLGSTILEDYWHTGATDPRFWKGPVEELLTESMENAEPLARQFTSRDARFRIALMSVLLRDASGSMIGVLSLVVRVDADHQAQTQREVLEAVATQVALGLAVIERRNSAPKSDAPSDELSRAAGYRSGVELAFALGSSLRNKYGCDQVAIGFAPGARARVVAVSGLDEISERAEAVRLIADAMGEAIDRGEPVVVQRDDHGGYRVHKRWHEASGGTPVASIPVEAGNGCRLIVSLRRAGDMPFRDDELRAVTSAVAPYAPAFEMLERASRSVVAHAKSSVKQQASGLVRPGGWARKAAVAAALAFAGWVCFGSLEYRVSSTATVVPSQQRHIAAPFGGKLAAVLVAPGDAVDEGQVLATLDTADLEVEREQLRSEIAIARLNEDRAIAEGASAEAEMARAERRRAAAQLEEVDRKISRSQICAPFTGKIVAGDLRKRIGETLPLGEPLFQVADTAGWTIEIEVPQRAAGDVAPGQAGRFAADARPEEQSSFSLARVNPLPEIREGRSVYVAEAEVVNGADWLKPGMEGGARVAVGRKPVWWIASHRVVDYLRMNFWL